MASAATETMSGLRKAAVLLLQMDKDDSARVLSRMRDAEVEELSAEIVRLQAVDSDVAEGVLEEFHELVSARRFGGEGGLAVAREMLVASLGADRAGVIMGRLSAAVLNMPFQFLHEADPRQVLSFLADEHPQTIALVLAHLTAEQATTILAGLQPALQADVAHRIGVMERTSPDIVRQVEAQLQPKLSSLVSPSDASSVGGLQPLVDIVNRADRGTEKLILEGLEGRDKALADEVRSRLFMFEDIVSLDDRAVQLVLRQVETADLATALKGVRDDVRDKITRNLSERAAENLVEEIDLLGPVRLRQVEESQAKVVQVIRLLEEQGQIVVRRGSNDEFVA